MTQAPPRSAVLFDIDGTLIDSTYHHALAWHRAFRRTGLQVPIFRIHRTIGMGGDKLVAHVTDDDVEAEHGDTLRERWEEEYAEVLPEVAALDGATALVKSLVADGYSVALASSGKKHFSQDAVRILDVTDDVHAMTSSEDAAESKPEPDIIGAALDRLDVDRAVFVGDTPYDVESAARLGLRCVGVLTGGYSRAELEEADAALVVASLTELADLDWSEHLAEPRRS